MMLSLLACVAIIGAEAQKVTVHNFPTFKAHVYTSTEAMGDVSILVEGDKGLVVLEPQSFYKSIKDFNAYAEKLGKPIVKIVANYHAGGLASMDKKKIVMVEPMVAFMQTPQAQGMLKKFAGAFKGAMDTRSVKIKKTIPATSKQQWAGVDFNFTAGSVADFPASSVNIGGKVYYMHFAPNRKHPAPMLLKNAAALDATLAEMKKAKASGCELFVGSHGAEATAEDVDFLISYLTKVKELLATCKDADRFGQQLILAYPKLDGAENIRSIAKALYPNATADAEVEAVRARMQDYFNMISNLDFNIAKGLWAENDNISFINPRTHLVGYNQIKNGLTKGFSQFKFRKLSSLNEVINIYGDAANIQLYWKFDTIDAKGKKNQTRGRESLIFSKINGEWRLVHVHYSRMPE